MIIKLLDILTDDEKVQLLNEIKLLNESSDSPGWKFSGSSNEENKNKLFWYLNVENNLFFSEVLFDSIKKHIKYYCNEDVKIQRIYLNGHTFGQQGYLHEDDTRENSRTLLIYCNDYWNIEYAGATVFNCEEDIYTVYPEPFSGVYFPGYIKHFSQPVSKDFLGLRITLAYKLITI